MAEYEQYKSFVEAISKSDPKLAKILETIFLLKDFGYGSIQIDIHNHEIKKISQTINTYYQNS